MALDSRPTDRYTPFPATAACPYCAAVVADVHLPDAAQFALFRFICARCRQPWSESRDHAHADVARFYARAAAAGGGAHGR